MYNLTNNQQLLVHLAETSKRFLRFKKAIVHEDYIIFLIELNK